MHVNNGLFEGHCFVEQNDASGLQRRPSPMHLRHAETTGLKGCHAYRASRYITAYGSDTCMQRCTVQGVALAKLSCMVQEATRFAVELIVNFKFRLMIHLPCPRT